MTQFAVIKNGLLPHDDAAFQMLSKLKIGAVIDVQVLHPMHVKFNAKIHACISRLAKASGVTHDEMQARLLVLTGRFKLVPLSNHKKVTVVDSMSRATMTDDDRQEFWKDMQEVVAQVILPVLDDRDADEIRAMFDTQPQEDTAA